MGNDFDAPFTRAEMDQMRANREEYDAGFEVGYRGGMCWVSEYDSPDYVAGWDAGRASYEETVSFAEDDSEFDPF